MSVIVVSIGVVGYVSAVGLASKELWFGRRDSELSMLVTDQLESLKALGTAAVASGSRVEGPYRLDWQVQGNNPKTVTLIVQYDRGSGGQQQDTVVAYVR